MKIYYYLFYKFYCIGKKTNPNDPQWTALALLSCCIFVYVMPFIFIFLGKGQISLFPKLIGWGSIIIIGSINYYIFIKKEKYKVCVEMFKNETK